MPIITSKSKIDKSAFFNGEIIAVIPKMPKILKILDPITLPRAMSSSCLIAATMLVASSGKLVPAATIVNPIIASGMLQSFAMKTAPARKAFAPVINPINPRTVKAIAL